jgi:hypothetical protein
MGLYIKYHLKKGRIMQCFDMNKRRAGMIIAMLAASALYVTAWAADAPSAGAKVLTVDHPMMSFTVNPAAGGRIERLAFKEWGGTILAVPKLGGEPGLLLDHLEQQPWPGELMNAKYELLSDKSEGVMRTISLRAKIADTPENREKGIAGVAVEKTIRVKDGAPVIEVVYTLRNESAEPRRATLWIQNVLDLAATSGAARFDRPTATGIDSAAMRAIDGKIDQKQGQEWVKEPYAGWTAAVAPGTGTGLIWVTDYNDTKAFYNCLPVESVEMFYERVTLKPGGAWRTRILIRPLAGVQQIVHADENVVIAVAKPMCIADGKRQLDLSFFAIGSAIAKGKVSVRMEEMPGRKLLTEVTKSFDASPANNELARLSCVWDANTENVFLAAKVDADGNRVSSVELPLYGNPDAMMQGFNLGYMRVQPPKTARSGEGPLIHIPNGKLEVLSVEGLYASEWRMSEAFNAWPGVKIDRAFHIIPPDNHDYIGNVELFPDDPAKLVDYDVIVLNNTPAKAISAELRRGIRRFVEGGGILIITGGHFSFGGGEYGVSEFAGLLPVKVGKGFDVKKSDAAVTMPDGTPLAKGALVSWIHTLESEKDAIITLKVGDAPFWLYHNVGKGKVAVCLGTVYGRAPEGKADFWRTREWIDFVAGQLKTMEVAP